MANVVKTELLATDSARAVQERFRARGHTKDGMFEALAGAFKQAHVVTKMLNEAERVGVNHLPVCHEGCAYCCHQAIFITAPEALLLAQYLVSERDAQTIATLKAHLETQAAKLSGLPMKERQLAREPCPMLDVSRGSCTVHPIRPLPCRSANSCSVDQCIAAFESKDLSVTVSQSPFQAPVFKAVWWGMMAALQAEGLDAEVYEIGPALLVALEPEALDRWLAGEHVFARARTTASRSLPAEYRSIVAPVLATLRER